MAELIPLVHLSKTYSSAAYIQVDGLITFDVATNKTSISKACFCRMLGLDSSEGLVDPDLILSIDLINIVSFKVQEAQSFSNVEQVVYIIV